MDSIYTVKGVNLEYFPLSNAKDQPAGKAGSDVFVCWAVSLFFAAIDFRD